MDAFLDIAFGSLLLRALVTASLILVVGILTLAAQPRSKLGALMVIVGAGALVASAAMLLGIVTMRDGLIAFAPLMGGLAAYAADQLIKRTLHRPMRFGHLRLG